MHTQFDDEKPFITLLTHANYSVPPINLIDSALVLTKTESEASALVTNKLFNLIILDMDLNGLSLVTLAKTSDCINCHTPIIALVEIDASEQRKHLITAGFDDCFLKPLTAIKLNEFIKFWRENDASSSYLESIQTLLTKFRGNKALVLTLYMKLIEELPQQIEQIKAALKNGQYGLAFDTTHKINASAKIFYLKSLEDLAKTLEECLRQKRYGLAEGYFSMLEYNINTLINHRQSILDYLEK